MRFPLLHPRWLGTHLMAVLAALGCLGLGYWQYERAQEPDRSAITNPVEDLARATDIGALLEPGAYMPLDLANEAVRTSGVYDAENQLLSPALSPEGEEGYYVIVPLVTDDGAAVTVNRGWIPLDAAGADGAVPPVPDGEATVSGWLMPPQGEATRGYTAIVSEGQIARISSALLVNEWPYPLYEGYVTLAEQTPAETAGAASQLREIPPPDPPQEITWNIKNLSYAAQWVVFGIAVVVFWISLMRRELDERRAAREGGAGGTASPSAADGPQPSVAGATAD
ncbi:SURF1 family protein [Actinorugispora endophytica]|uniref:SURF1 family protein n=1 Tax=Actinorugispora endophytica TaxID=1605990 RepID=UPI001060E592|nr:SURF1 family protein [Actinorugispora endophytica]